jgi:hypothetical protein
VATAAQQTGDDSDQQLGAGERAMTVTSSSVRENALMPPRVLDSATPR